MTPSVATGQVLLARRIEHLDALRRGRALHGLAGQATLAEFAKRHLVAKAKSGMATESWLELSELHLNRAITHFGATKDLGSIATADVRAWAEQLERHGLSGGTVRHHLNTLSNLYKRARAERIVPSGYNPVGDLLEKPRAGQVEAKWLEVPDAALLLEAARTYRPVTKGGPAPLPFAHELIGTFLLTGGRESEVLGVEVDDLSHDRGTVTFRPNVWRRRKSSTSHRSVPLWPQLREVLDHPSPRDPRADCCSRATGRGLRR